MQEAIFKNIRDALENAPRNGYVAELHLQSIKYADELAGLTGREFAETLGIGASFGTEFMKMRKVAARLVAAGLNPKRI